jgi:hypothetical protein
MVDVNISMDGSMNGKFLPNNGTTAFAIIRIDANSHWEWWKIENSRLLSLKLVLNLWKQSCSISYCHLRTIWGRNNLFHTIYSDYICTCFHDFSCESEWTIMTNASSRMIPRYYIMFLWTFFIDRAWSGMLWLACSCLEVIKSDLRWLEVIGYDILGSFIGILNLQDKNSP